MGGLGRLLGRLGAAWAVLCENDALVSAARAFSVLKLVSRWGHFGSPSGAKSESKTMIKTKQKKDALDDRLGAVLGPSWVDLGSSWVPSWGHVW